MAEPETVDVQMCTLCLGNLPQMMHQKLEPELYKFFLNCHIMKIFLLDGQNFCFIRFKTPTNAQEAIKLVKQGNFCGKILRFERRSPTDFVPNFQDVIAEIYQTQEVTANSQLPNPAYAQAQAQQNFYQQQQKNLTAHVQAAHEQAITPAQPKPRAEDPFLEVLDLPVGTSDHDFFMWAQPFGAIKVKCRPPTGRVYCEKERREELYTAIDGAAFNNRRIRCRYPPYDGPKSKKYKDDETCRIIVEGVSDPDHKEVSRLLPMRFEAFGKVSGCEILRNRTPSCAFIDIERNIAEVAAKSVDSEYFFGEQITVALMKQDDVIIIDSEEELADEKKKAILPANNLLPSKITIPSPNNVNKVVELMCERQRLEVLHPYEEYLLQVAPPEGSAGLDDSEPLPNPPQQFIRLLMDRAMMRVKLMKLANCNRAEDGL